MGRIWMLALCLSLGVVHAQGAEEVLDRVQATLEAGPWTARVAGRILTPDGSLQEAEMILKVVPEAEVARVDFIRTDAVADNYVVITPEEVYNYLFLTNQVVVYPRERARVEGLGFDFSRANLDELLGRGDVVWRLEGVEPTPEGEAWKLVGTADELELGFAEVGFWALKAEARPYRMVLRNAEGEVVAELDWVEWRRADLTVEALKSFPLDAEVIRK